MVWRKLFLQRCFMLHRHVQCGIGHLSLAVVIG